MGRTPPVRTRVSNRAVAQTYDRFSGLYDRLVAPFETTTATVALNYLDPSPGEYVLELGSGPGRDMVRIAARLRGRGRVLGVDAAPGMVRRANERCRRAGVTETATAVPGDARALPVREDSVTAVYCADTLELFSRADVRRVLSEVRRVLRDDGRLCLVTMERSGAEESSFVRAYEWLYRTLPGYGRVGCRPIYAGEALSNAGFRIEARRRLTRAGVWPVDVFLARPATKSSTGE